MKERIDLLKYGKLQYKHLKEENRANPSDDLKMFN